MKTVPGGPAPTDPGRGLVVAGRYELGGLLGRGGMAEVFAGNDRRLDRPVAVKLLLPAMAARPEIRTRFEAEARAAASLSHPNAVAVFDTGEHRGIAFIVMERLPGETLADRIGAGPVDPAWLRTIATEVLSALGAAHAVGLVHRDVKPGNILLAADGRAKVADFGIAKSAEARGRGDITATGELLGTPAYLAPERLDGAPATPASDLWAVGVVLYEALTGTKPFTGETPLATARAVAAGTPRRLSQLRPDLDPVLVATVERAMAPDPAARFASAGDMAAALAALGTALTAADTVEVAVHPTLVLGEPDVVAPPPVPPPAPEGHGGRRNPGRRRLGWVAVGGLVMLVLLLLARTGSGHRPAPAGPGAAPATTAQSPATTASPSAALAQQLRATATRLGPGDGPLASILAARLRSLADQVEAGGGGTQATGLLAATVAWDRAGVLSDATASSVVALLSQVPGINTSVVNALTTTAPASPSAPSPAPPRGPDAKDKGKGKHD